MPSSLLVSAPIGPVPSLLQSFAIEFSQPGLKIALVSHGVFKAQSNIFKQRIIAARVVNSRSSVPFEINVVFLRL